MNGMQLSGWPLAFGFLSPWLLAGGLALSAVPLLIHLLRRKQYVDRPWAAMQFLRAAVQSQARRVRLESLALLAVRMLLIGLAATALAQPYLDELGRSLGAAAGRQRVLIVDTSLSMTAAAPGGTPLETARALAARVVQTAPAADAFSLVRIGRTPPLALIPQAAYDRDVVLEQVRRLAATQQAADVAGALRAARDCLRHQGRTPRAEIIIISDFQKSNWIPDSRPEIESLLRELADNATVTCLPVPTAASANLAVTELQPASAPLDAGGTVDVEATLLNPSSQPALAVPVEVFSGERLLGAATVDVPARDSATVRIPLRGLAPADASVRAEIPDDVLHDDNRRWTVLPDRRPLEVLLVSGRPRTSDRRGAADFVNLALSPAGVEAGRSAIATTVINDDRLQETDFHRYGCVYLCNVALLSDADAARLRTYVEGGGGLVLALGDQVQPGGYRALQAPGHGALLPGELVAIAGADDPAGEAVRLSPGDYVHPVIRPFAGNPDAGLITTDISRYWRLRLSEDIQADVVLNYSTGDPAIVERRLGAGRVLTVTTALDDSWSNWALWPSFVPIVHELTRAAAAGRIAERSRLVGDSLTFTLRPEDFSVSVEHLSPDAIAVEIPRRMNPDGSSTVTAVAESAGIHTLQLGPPRSTAERFAVNVSPEESRLTALDREELLQLMPDRALRFLQEWQPETAVAASHGGTLSSLLMLVVLGLLLVEQLMAWRFRVGAACLLLLATALLGAAASGRSEFVLCGVIVLMPVAVLAGLRRRAAVSARGDADRF